MHMHSAFVCAHAPSHDVTTGTQSHLLTSRFPDGCQEVKWMLLK